MSDIDNFKNTKFKGRDARLYREWDSIAQKYSQFGEVYYRVRKRNQAQLPVVYEIVYNIRSFCGVEEADAAGLQRPIYADRFIMRINIPNNYPSMDAKLEFKFMTQNMAGEEIPHPWHPNIRYFGDFAGRVCINMADTFTDLVWGVLRVAQYLRYETYHAVYEPPYPEDMKVAAWVTKQGEPNGWISFES